MIKIRTIMTKEVVTISKEESIMSAAKIMVSKSVSSLVIVERGKPIATVSQNDVIKGIVSKKKKVREVMGAKFMTISPKTKFSEVSEKLRRGQAERFAVVDGDKLVGLITETDIVQATRDLTRIEQMVQEVILGIFGLATAFFLFYFSPVGSSIFR